MAPLVFYGSGAVGSVVLPPPVNPTPPENGLFAWTFDPVHVTGNAVMASGTTYASRLPLGAARSASNLHFLVSSTATGLTYASFGLYTAAGVKVADTGDAIGALGSTGNKTVPFAGGPITLPDTPALYVVALVVGTTGPGIGRPGILSGAQNLGAATARRSGTTAAGVSALPASINPATVVGGGNVFYWFGLS